jgi:hypothetical protein
MHPYRPNKISRRARVLLALSVGLLLLVVGAELATGYTYLPGKRGGLLLSGIPTLAIAASLIALCAACVLTIIDHYDKRPNEDIYKANRRIFLKAAFWLFLAAPFLQLAISLLQLAGVNLPTFPGIANHYTLHSSELQQYVRYVNPVLDRALLIGLVSALLGGLGLLMEKLSPGQRKRSTAVLIGAGLLGLSSLLLASATRNFLSGEVETGRRHYREVVRAENSPAKFNAVLLTHFGIGGILFSASIATLVLAALPKPARRVRRK